MDQVRESQKRDDDEEFHRGVTDEGKRRKHGGSLFHLGKRGPQGFHACQHVVNREVRNESHGKRDERVEKIVSFLRREFAKSAKREMRAGRDHQTDKKGPQIHGA